MNENAPITVSDRINTVANTGRRTHRAASHCIVHTFRWPSVADLGAVDQARHVGRRHTLARLDAVGDLDTVVHRLPDGDDALLGAVAVDDIEPAGAAGRCER